MKRTSFFILGLILVFAVGCEDDARPAAPGVEGSAGAPGAGGGDGEGRGGGADTGDDGGLRPGEGMAGGSMGVGGANGPGGDTLSGGAMGTGGDDGAGASPGAGGLGQGAAAGAGGGAAGGGQGFGGEDDLRGMAGALGEGGDGGMGGAGGGAGRIDLGLSPVECRQDEQCGEGYCRPVPNIEGAASYCVMPVERPILPCEDPDADPAEGTCCQDRHCRVDDVRGHCAVNSAGICGMAPAEEMNICRFDQCYRAADCGQDEICIPAGFRGDLFNRCVRAQCRISADCDVRPGGQCRILSTGTNCTGEPVFVCTYPDDPCRTDRDCLEGWRCTLGDAGISCLEATPDP